VQPLRGIKVVEFGGIGPGPFAATVLADMGADVIRLQRHGPQSPVDLPGGGADLSNRPAVSVDLKSAEHLALVRELLASADALIEGFRPGVMERLGLGPDAVRKSNPRLVYARITGYGQTGPMAHDAGHDINYLAVSGVLSALARAGESPLAPLNLLADYGGGGMLVALGIVGALLQAQRSGHGQVVDAAMVDGVAQLARTLFSFASAGSWGPAGTNVLDGGAHFYNVYETADGGFFAVGAIEPQFYAQLLDRLGLDHADTPQWQRSRWPELTECLAAVFRTNTRAQWEEIFDGAQACATPVLTLSEAPLHPHHRARGTFRDTEQGTLPAPAPRFSLSSESSSSQSCKDQFLRQWDLSSEATARLLALTNVNVSNIDVNDR
jgi:alpha-methylacyl-CoA racemase